MRQIIENNIIVGLIIKLFLDICTYFIEVLIGSKNLFFKAERENKKKNLRQELIKRNIVSNQIMNKQ